LDVFAQEVNTADTPLEFLLVLIIVGNSFVSSLVGTVDMCLVSRGFELVVFCLRYLLSQVVVEAAKQVPKCDIGL
jgi:hypothetical protein